MAAAGGVRRWSAYSFSIFSILVIWQVPAPVRSFPVSKSVAIAVGKDEDAMLALVRRLVPHATAGYSPELAARYKRDPRSLLLRSPGST